MMIYGPGMGWLWMGFTLVVLTTLLVVAIVAGVRKLDEAALERGDGEPAHRVLADRFARGEITEEEYRHRLAVLRAAHR